MATLLRLFFVEHDLRTGKQQRTRLAPQLRALDRVRALVFQHQGLVEWMHWHRR